MQHTLNRRDFLGPIGCASCIAEAVGGHPEWTNCRSYDLNREVR